MTRISDLAPKSAPAPTDLLEVENAGGVSESIPASSLITPTVGDLPFASGGTWVRAGAAQYAVSAGVVTIWGEVSPIGTTSQGDICGNIPEEYRFPVGELPVFGSIYDDVGVPIANGFAHLRLRPSGGLYLDNSSVDIPASGWLRFAGTYQVGMSIDGSMT